MRLYIRTYIRIFFNTELFFYIYTEKNKKLWQKNLQLIKGR